MLAMAVSKKLEQALERERRAFADMHDRIARNDLDWGYYEDPAEKPKTLREKLEKLYEVPPALDEQAAGGQETPKPRLPWWLRFLRR